MASPDSAPAGSGWGGCRHTYRDITRHRHMWSIPGAKTPQPTLQIGVSPLPLHGEKQPLGRCGRGWVLGCWRAHVSSRHVEMGWKRTRLHTERMKAGRISSSSSRSPSSCAGSQHGPGCSGSGVLPRDPRAELLSRAGPWESPSSNFGDGPKAGGQDGGFLVAAQQLGQRSRFRSLAEPRWCREGAKAAGAALPGVTALRNGTGHGDGCGRPCGNLP